MRVAQTGARVEPTRPPPVSRGEQAGYDDRRALMICDARRASSSTKCLNSARVIRSGCIPWVARKVAYVGVGDRDGDVAGQPVHERGWSVCSSPGAVPNREVVAAGASFGEGRDVGKWRRAVRGRDAERHEVAGRERFRRGRDRRHRVVRRAGDDLRNDIRDRITRVGRHVGRIDPDRAIEQLRTDVGACADTRRTEPKPSATRVR